tara:strand:- start:2380 stop:2601 length:222 start_codon:yes stop_codon:yes gene_type:complete
MIKFQKGALVKWYESYADDLDMIKGYGLGILMGAKVHKYEQNTYTTLTVYRNRFNDIITLPESNVEIISQSHT